VLLAGIVITASLLSVVVADGLVAQEQVSLASTQGQLSSDLAQQKQLQVAVAEQSAPQIVVSEAKQLGLVAPPQVIDLPNVSLSVALPVPNTAPLATPPTTTSPPAK
jgi:hypothetical protein